MNKKILFLSTLPPPFYGASVVSEKCLEILKKTFGIQVENIKLNYSKEMSDVGKIKASKVSGFFKVRKQIKKSLKELCPDLVYFAPATANLGLLRDFLFIRQIKKSKIPIIFHIHSRVFHNNSAYNFLYKRMFQNEKAVVLGKELVSDIDKYVNKKNIFILPNAIDNIVNNNEFLKIRQERKKKKVVDLLFLSNMDKTKGWVKVLEACKILKNKNLNFRCSFVGDWVDKIDEIKFNKYKTQMQKQIFYLGKKTGNEKNKIYKNSDILIFPTYYKLETFGMVIIEAMMFGLPVVASNVASIPSIVSQKKTGFLLKENSPDEIANYVEQLIKNQSLREKMSTQGRKKFLDEFESRNYEKKLRKIIFGT